MLHPSSILSHLISVHQNASFYLKQVQFLLMYMFQYDQPFTKTDLANLTVEAAKKTFHKGFWTRHQKDLIEKDSKRVLFTSNFGTGKTLLLRTKAELLGRKKGILTSSRRRPDQEDQPDQRENELRRTFFVFLGGKDLLLFQSIREEFKKLKLEENVQVEVLCLESKFKQNFVTCIG